MARRGDVDRGTEYRIKKPVEFWASDERLLNILRPLVCDRSHDHADLSATNSAVPHAKAKDTARWPIALCRKVAAGCEEVLQDPRTATHVSIDESCYVGVFVSVSLTNLSAIDTDVPQGLVSDNQPSYPQSQSSSFFR